MQALYLQILRTIVLSPGRAPPYLTLTKIHYIKKLIQELMIQQEINNFVYLITVSVPSFSALFHPDPVTSCCKGPAAEVKNKLYN